ncbi:hypothetical protein [Rhizobium sp. Root482]|uniref:hypothetical protein n=1 Tax=Rhizobium sp. Root482 TaxID=1736543 RepID=UPI000AB5DF6E|nr:hypothetical protein [Rhizobium sp. Root482]
MKDKNQKILTNWILDTFKKKVIFDIRNQLDTSVGAQDNYLSRHTFSTTVILRKSSRYKTINQAQDDLKKHFSSYYNDVLGHQCMDNRKLTSRNMKFLPMSFLGFDIEGTRHGSYDVVTSDPHGHGGILFHETTLANFAIANARFLQLDGSYEITNPTREIALITLEPFDCESGMTRFLHYALKFGVKLDNNNTNYSPYNFYPPSSPNYPFWQTLQTDMYPLTRSDDWKERENATIEWLRNMAPPDRRFRRNLGHGGGATTSRNPVI